jgi:hypothetical protein
MSDAMIANRHRRLAEAVERDRKQQKLCFNREAMEDGNDGPRAAVSGTVVQPATVVSDVFSSMISNIASHPSVELETEITTADGAIVKATARANLAVYNQQQAAAAQGPDPEPEPESESEPEAGPESEPGSEEDEESDDEQAPSRAPTQQPVQTRTVYTTGTVPGFDAEAAAKRAFNHASSIEGLVSVSVEVRGCTTECVEGCDTTLVVTSGATVFAKPIITESVVATNGSAMDTTDLVRLPCNDGPLALSEPNIPAAMPPLPDLPPLPPKKDRLEGKYITNGGPTNGFTPTVVYFKAGARCVRQACWAQGCNGRPSFGPVDTFGTQHAIFCATHCDQNLHEDVVSKRCEAPGCEIIPSFGPKGTFGKKHAIFCVEHCDQNLHENVVSKRCEAPGCETQSTFGPKGTFGGKHAIFCAEHCDQNLHEDVVSKRCTAMGCKTRASFGPKGTFGKQHAIFCAEHCDQNLHEDAVNRRCEAPGCKTHAYFGPKGMFGWKHAIFCATHCDQNLHEDVVNKRCAAPGCKTGPRFGPIGTSGTKHAIYCAEHCDQNLHEDVITKRCTTDGCPKQAQIHDPDNTSVNVCKACAGNLGLIAKSKAGASVACSLCFDELEEELGVKIGWRVTYHTDCTRTGAEKFGLVPSQPRLHPDGYTEPTGDEPGIVLEFHGDYYHGYPPWHPKHETSVFRGWWGPTRYKETMERMQLFKAQGLRVLYIWESDWLATKKTGATLALRDALREV